MLKIGYPQIYVDDSGWLIAMPDIMDRRIDDLGPLETICRTRLNLVVMIVSLIYRQKADCPQVDLQYLFVFWRHIDWRWVMQYGRQCCSGLGNIGWREAGLYSWWCYCVSLDCSQRGWRQMWPQAYVRCPFAGLQRVLRRGGTISAWSGVWGYRLRTIMSHVLWSTV